MYTIRIWNWKKNSVMNRKFFQLIRWLILFSIVVLIARMLQRSTKNESKGEKSLLYNIFFIETNKNATSFTLRQLCSIESAAKNNPNAQINVLSINATIQLKDLMKTYKNINYTQLNPRDIFKDTPLYDWWITNKLTNFSEYFTYAHLADALRLAVLYKNGGFYLDLDFITLKSLEPLSYKIEFISSAANEYSYVENAFIHSPKNHSFIYLLMSEFARNYEPDNWAANGPTLISTNILKQCQISNYTSLMNSENRLTKEENAIFMKNSINKSEDRSSCGITVLPFYYAFPYHYTEVAKLFLHDGFIDVSRIIKSYCIHFNSFITNQMVIDFNEYSFYEFFAAFNCPVVHFHL